MLPFFGKTRRRLPRPRWVNPCPHQGKTLGAGVSAPCVPQSLPSARRRRLDPPGGAPGRGSHRSPRPLSASPASRTEAELQIQWLGTNPSLAPTRGRSRRVPLPPETGSPSNPSYPPLEESPAPPLAAASPPRKGLAPRLDGGTEWPRGPSSMPQLPTRSHLPAGAHRRAHPCRPRRSVPVARLPSSPGTQTAAPTCGRGAERGLQPLPAPAAARVPPTPSARTRLLPALRTAEASGRRGVAPEGKRGWGALQVTLAHPFPEEPPAGRGRWGGSSERRAPIKPRWAEPPSRCSAGPARRARGRPRPSVTHSPPARIR